MSEFEVESGVQSGLGTAAKRFGIKIITRKVEDGIRVWRVA